MMQLDTEPTTAGLRAGWSRDDGMAVLIQVPRVDQPRVRLRVWRPEEAGRSRPAASSRGSRPRRRLRRGVRLVGCWIVALASMGGTFAMGWMTRDGGSLHWPVLHAAAIGRNGGHAPFATAAAEQPADGPPVEADAIATGPALGAPVADAEVPVVFPGYVLPDDSLEEPAHEGS